MKNRLSCDTAQHLKSQSIFLMNDYEGYERTKSNFPYRKLFTPDLNDFLYTKVTILSFISFISFISGKDSIRKYIISAS